MKAIFRGAYEWTRMEELSTRGSASTYNGHKH
jgi:hypothetical protein